MPANQIHQKALEAIRNAALTGENFALLFERMATGLAGVASPGGLLVLNYLDPNQMPEEGELVPTITLALKPFTLRQPLRPASRKPKEEPKEEKPPYENPFKHGPHGQPDETDKEPEKYPEE